MTGRKLFIKVITIPYASKSYVVPQISVKGFFSASDSHISPVRGRKGYLFSLEKGQKGPVLKKDGVEIVKRLLVRIFRNPGTEKFSGSSL